MQYRDPNIPFAMVPDLAPVYSNNRFKAKSIGNNVIYLNLWRWEKRETLVKSQIILTDGQTDRCSIRNKAVCKS